MSDGRPHAESSTPPERKRIRRLPMEQPAIPLSLYSSHRVPPSQAPAQPESSGPPQLPPLQQDTMQRSHPPIQNVSGSARTPLPLQQARGLLLTQQKFRMSTEPRSSGQPANLSTQGGVGMQIYSRQLQLPQQPGFNATPLAGLAPPTTQNTVGMMPTPSPRINRSPKEATNKPPQLNGQSQWLSQQWVPEAWNALSRTAPPNTVGSNQTSPRSQQPAPSNPGWSAAQTPGSGPEPPIAMRTMLCTPVGMPRANTGDLGTFPPNFISDMDKFADLNFERDFGEWFNGTDE